MLSNRQYFENADQHREQGRERMESIVKMGVSGKNTYGKNEQRGAAAGADSDSRQGKGAYQDSGGTASGESKSTMSAALPVTDEKEKQKLEQQKAEQKRQEEQRRLAAEERLLQKKRRRHYRLIMRFAIATIVISYVLIQLTGNLNTVLSAVGKWLTMIGLLLQPLFWGFVLAYILNPAVNSCQKKLRRVKLFGKKRGNKRGAAVAITCLVAFLIIFVILSVVVSAVTRSLRLASLDDLVVMVQSFTASLSSLQKMITARLSEMNISTEEVEKAMKSIGSMIGKLSKGLSSGLTNAIGHIGGFLTSLLFAVIFAIYFLLDGKGLVRYWNRVLLAIGGRKVRREFHVLVKDADSVFSGYIRGQLIDALLMAVLVSVSLSLIGVKYAVIIGVLSGIGNLIPYVGPIVAYGSTILVCIIAGDFRRLLVAVVVLFVIQTVDGNVINPRLLSSSIDVHPMLVIAALIIGGSVGGIVGMLFAVPVAAFLRIQFDKIIDTLIKARTPERGASGRQKKKKSAAKKKSSQA